MFEASVSTEKSLKTPKEMNARELAEYCAGLAFEKKALNLVLLDLQDRSSVTDYFLIMSATSTPQVQAIADHIVRHLKDSGFKKIHAEGVNDGRWALLDLGDVVIHIFQDYMREFYNLEGLWQDAPRIRVEEKR